MNKSTKSVDLFQLTKSFMHFSGQNPNIKHQHVALIWYIIETSNSKRWQQEFALYSETAMSVAGFSNSKTYCKTLEDLEQLGFIKLIQRSRNQYTQNIIQICWGKFDEALPKQNISTSKALHKQSPTTSLAVPDIKNNKDVIKHIKQNKLFKTLEKDIFKSHLLEKSFFKEFRDCYSMQSEEYDFVNQIIEKIKCNNHEQN